MLRGFCTWVLYKLLGWSKDVTIEFPKKVIICVAPHTSNWDFFIGQLYIHSEGLESNFLMKKEWFFWPVGIFLKHLGGIPVCRSKKSSMTTNLAHHAIQADVFRLCITPEGTRSLRSEWKRGFYFIAMKANIPIQLYGIDYKKKSIVCKKILYPTGNIDKDMTEIKLYFKDFVGKHPENFTIGKIE